MKLTIISLAFLFLAAPHAHALIYNEEKQTATLEKIDDYNECQRKDRTGNVCQKALEAWIDSNPLDTFTAAKMTRAKMNAYNAVPLFKRAFEAGPQDCKDADLQLAVSAAFEKLLPNGKDATLADAQQLAFETCHDSMTQDLDKKIAKADARFKQNVCDGIAKFKQTKRALPPQLTKACR